MFDARDRRTPAQFNGGGCEKVVKLGVGPARRGSLCVLDTNTVVLPPRFPFLLYPKEVKIGCDCVEHKSGTWKQDVVFYKNVPGDWRKWCKPHWGRVRKGPSRSSSVFKI